MSGIPKRKYQRLKPESDLTMGRIVNEDTHKNYIPEETQNPDAKSETQFQGEDSGDNLHNQLEAMDLEHSFTSAGKMDGLAPKLYSTSSSLDGDIELDEREKASISDKFRLVTSSRSESWVTASSVMGDSPTGSARMSPRRERNLLFSFKSANDEMQSACDSFALTSSKTAEFCTGQETTRRRSFSPMENKCICRSLEKVNIPAEGCLRSSESFTTSNRAYSRRLSARAGSNECVASLPTRSKRQPLSSPSKILRMKWKRLFAPKTYETVQSSFQHSIPPVSFHRASKDTDVKLGAQYTNPLDVHLHEDKVTQTENSTHMNLLQSNRCARSTLNKTTKRSSNLTCTPSNYLDASSSPSTKRPLSFDSVHEKSRRKSALDTRWKSVPKRISLLHYHSCPVVYPVGGRAVNAISGWEAEALTKEKGNGNEPKISPTDTCNPSSPDQKPASEAVCKTTFEEEEEDDKAQQLLRRDAHIGAFALAWVADASKAKRAPQRATSGSIEVENPQEVKFHLRDKYFTQKTQSSRLKSPGKSKLGFARRESQGIAEVVSASTKTAFLPLNIRGRVTRANSRLRTSRTLCSAKSDLQTVTEHSVTDDQTAQIRPRSSILSNKLLPDSLSGSKVSLNLFRRPSKNDESKSEEDGELSPPVQGLRANIRRGGQDIRVPATSGGILSSAQKNLLQKNQTHNIGWRLSERRRLNEKRRHIADYSFLLAVSGILLMVVELEMLMAQVYTRASFYSLLMKSLISASTLVLICLIVFYHALDVKLFSVNNCIEDWRIAINHRKVFLVTMEVIVCLIHPPPVISNLEWGHSNADRYQSVVDPQASNSPVTEFTHPSPLNFAPPTFIPVMYGISTNVPSDTFLSPQKQSAPSFSVRVPNSDLDTEKKFITRVEDSQYVGHINPENLHFTPLPASVPLFSPPSPTSPDPTVHSSSSKSEYIPLEVSLSVPMFVRLYLIFRVLLLHSTFFTDAGSRSIGAMNRVKINVRFVLKTMATARPATTLFILIICMWIITSWIMRICERQQNPEYEKMFNTMWLIAVTFLSIGYGDMVPNTYCGRSVSVIAGVLGSACTALVVALVARKLELSRAEKHVHNFMEDNKIYKKLRHSAANVLRETWLFYKYTRLVKRVNPARVRRHQRKFLAAIGRLRRAKDAQRKMKENASSMIDLGKTQLNELPDVLRNIMESTSKELYEQLSMTAREEHRALLDVNNSPDA